MASEPAISVQRVGKRYDMYRRNLDRVKDLVTGSRKRATEFWALRDVSFEVLPGQAVGVVGRNGSGKSTLMQIVAGTLTPTEGQVIIRGRVSALLELGSGFNPQFTGRENVFLQGSIMGIARREMEDRFDQIASFADIGAFMDQPVELYSSGMHARLAFSVAVSVQPDILIVDETLSVGDAGFQQRCIGRMRQMLDSGVTMLFVSHSADMVKGVCSRGLFLEKGRQMFFGTSAEATDRYTESLKTDVNERAIENAARVAPELKSAGADDADASEVVAGLRYGSGHARITAVRLLGADGRAVQTVSFGERVCVEAVVKAGSVSLTRLDMILSVRDRAGVDVFGATAVDDGQGLPELEPGQSAVVRFEFVNTLAAGVHGVSLSLTRRPDARGNGLLTIDHLDGCAAFEVLSQKRPVRGRVKVPVTITCERSAQAAPATT